MWALSTAFASKRFRAPVRMAVAGDMTPKLPLIGVLLKRLIWAGQSLPHVHGRLPSALQKVLRPMIATALTQQSKLVSHLRVQLCAIHCVTLPQSRLTEPGSIISKRFYGSL